MRLRRAGLSIARRLWPKSLFAQLLVIMISGTLAVQLLSSSIWFDVRSAQVFEAPVRLIASRTAGLIDQARCDAPGPIEQATRYLATCLDNAPEPASSDVRGRRRIELLMRQALEYESGHAQQVRVLKIGLTDEQGNTIVWRSLFGLTTALAHVRFAVPLPDGHWLQIQAHELQGWSGGSAWVLIADYLLRVYLLRILAVLVICLVAVRLCLRPLRRLSDAARGLGNNLEQPPLVIEGPAEVRQAAHAFNAMQQRLIEMLNDRTHFLAAVSHDLRTPLTRMRLRIEGIADPLQRERLCQNVADMESMIAQVLEFIQSAEQQPLQFVDVDLLLAKLQAELRTASEALPITGRGGVVQGNQIMLQRCLQNLLGNALRYARQVEIIVQRSPQGLSIEVQDRGPGIAEHLLASITDPFVRGDDSRNSQLGGYGLGLSIARRIAQSHGGSLTVRNRSGGGLSVQVYLTPEPS